MDDVTSILTKILKYFTEGLLVAIAAYLIPHNKKALSMEEIFVIGLTAAATFSILDTFLPTFSVPARTGAGFGIGAGLVGFPS